MTEQIERVVQQLQSYLTPKTVNMNSEAIKLIQEQAKEIERLNAQLNVQRSSHQGLESICKGLQHKVEQAVQERDLLRAECEKLRKQLVVFYTSGYHDGHCDTVEARYVDIHQADYPTYFESIVAEMVRNSVIYRKEQQNETT